jgi:hypothetical protein
MAADAESAGAAPVFGIIPPQKQQYFAMARFCVPQIEHLAKTFSLFFRDLSPLPQQPVHILQNSAFSRKFRI